MKISQQFFVPRHFSCSCLIQTVMKFPASPEKEFTSYIFCEEHTDPDKRVAAFNKVFCLLKLQGM